jgi:hydrogenase maturation protein HypF
MLARGTNSPPTSSVGRLFDAVASLIGLRHSAQFEAQAAMELEGISAPRDSRGYAVDINETAAGWEIDPRGMIRRIVDDLENGRRREDIAGAFHDGLAHAAADVAARISRRTRIVRVALSGGAFQNARLLDSTARALTRAGLEVLVHQAVPCNDGGLSLGQVWVCA